MNAKKLRYFKNFLTGKNKKGILAGTFVTVIALAIIFVVMLRFYGAILAIIKAVGEDYFACLLRKVISAYTKVPGLGITTWSAFCKPAVKTIIMLGEGEKTIPIDVTLTKRELKNLEEWYARENFEGDWYLEYRSNQAIAGEMKRCWGRNGQGELPLGSEWGKKLAEIGGGKVRYCDLCAVIKFDKEVQDKLDGQIDISEFLKKNPIRLGSSLSYWEYLKDQDVVTDSKNSGDLGSITYRTNQDLAIVYVKTNREGFSEVLKDVTIDWFPGVSDEDRPMPYDAVILRSIQEFREMNCRT